MMAIQLGKVAIGDTFTPDNGSTWITAVFVTSLPGKYVLIIGVDDRITASRYWGYTGDEVIVKI